MNKRMSTTCVLAGAAALALAFAPNAEAASGDAASAQATKAAFASVSVGTTNTVTLNASATVTVPGGTPQIVFVWLPAAEKSTYLPGLLKKNWKQYIAATKDTAHCKAAASPAHTYNCTDSAPVRAGYDVFDKDAGAQDLLVAVVASDGTQKLLEPKTTGSIRRIDRLTSKTSATSVKKGSSVTITGTLTRADWNTRKYTAYSSQTLSLQKRNAGSSVWSTVKTLKTDSKGNVRSTVKPAQSGTYRLVFTGNSTSAAVTSAATKTITVK